MPEDKAGGLSRRAVIASAAIIPVAALTAAAQPSATKPAERALSDTQLRLLAAFVDRLIPKDELGPSASESGVPEYINARLAIIWRARKLRSSKACRLPTRWRTAPTIGHL